MMRLKENRGLGLASSLGFALLLAIAAYFRFYDLGIKPPHFDEGINGHFILEVWKKGFYNYDPSNFHGPLYFYLLHLADILFGRSVESFRILNAALAVGLVALIFQFRHFVGRTAIWAAWIIALSPAFTFYGRYAIHETLFILGQVLFVYGRFLWMRKPARDASIAMAIGVVIQVATKETFFIFLGTWFIAEFCVRFLENWQKEPTAKTEPRVVSPKINWKEHYVVIGVAVLAVAALFSGFGENPDGIAGFFRAFNFWSTTGVKGNGHDKPWFYWLNLLKRYEWPMLIGLVTAAIGTWTLRREDRMLRVLILAGFGHWMAYTIIPYKTPWLLLSFWPLAFIAVPKWLERPKPRPVLAYSALGLVVLYSGVQAWRLNFINFVNPQEPYVYVQTTLDYKKVVNALEKKAAQDPIAKNSRIVVALKDPWPLPFDLSRFPRMGYARVEDMKQSSGGLLEADLILIDGTELNDLLPALPKRFARVRFQVRDAYDAGWALFDEAKFKDVLEPGYEVVGKEAP